MGGARGQWATAADLVLCAMQQWPCLLMRWWHWQVRQSRLVYLLQRDTGNARVACRSALTAQHLIVLVLHAGKVRACYVLPSCFFLSLVCATVTSTTLVSCMEGFRTLLSGERLQAQSVVVWCKSWMLPARRIRGCGVCWRCVFS